MSLVIGRPLVLLLLMVGMGMVGSVVTVSSQEETVVGGWNLTSNAVLTNVSIFVGEDQYTDLGDSEGRSNATEKEVGYIDQEPTHQLGTLDYNGEVSDPDLYSDFQRGGWEQVKGEGWYVSGYQDFQKEGVINPLKESALTQLNQDADEPLQPDDLIVEYGSISEVELTVELTNNRKELVRNVGKEQRLLMARLQVQTYEEIITVDLSEYVVELGLRDEGTPIRLSELEESTTGHQLGLNYSSIQSIHLLVSKEPNAGLDLSADLLFGLAGLLILSLVVVSHRKRC